MKILIVNGPNLNMLGVREKNLYGDKDYKALVSFVKTEARSLGVYVKCFQSNHEGSIVTAVQKAYGKYDGIVINAGAYTHTSVAILDALKAVGIPAVEVHLTDIENREEFRKTSFISLYAEKKICGRGFDGYKDALLYLVGKYRDRRD